MRRLRGHSTVRAFGALLIALALLGATVDLHVLSDDGHGHHGHHALDLWPAADGHLHVLESHPDQPVHVEGSIVLEHSHCITCMLRLQTPSPDLDLKAGVPTLVASESVRLPEPPAGELEAARWISARAPPHLV